MFVACCMEEFWHPGCVTFEGRIALGPPSIPPGACVGGQRAISVDSVDAKLTEIVAIGLQFWSSRRQFVVFGIIVPILLAL